MRKVYLASPMGFSEVTRPYMYETVIPKLHHLGLEVIDPWKLTPAEEIEAALATKDANERERKLCKLRLEIGRRNHGGIAAADFVIANLDGQEIDSGTASEIGAAAIAGKPVFAWRSDFRNSGELGAVVNLQVEYFVLMNGGYISRSLADLIEHLHGFLNRSDKVEIKRAVSQGTRAL